MGIIGQCIITSETGPDFPVEALFVQDNGGLDVSYSPGAVRISQTYFAISSGTLEMTDDTTNYVFINGAGAVTSNADGFPIDSIPLAEVVTASGSISGITDVRTFLAAEIGGLVPYATASGNGEAANTWVGFTGLPERKHWVVAFYIDHTDGSNNATAELRLNGIVAGGIYNVYKLNNTATPSILKDQNTALIGGNTDFLDASYLISIPGKHLRSRQCSILSGEPGTLYDHQLGITVLGGFSILNAIELRWSRTFNWTAELFHTKE